MSVLMKRAALFAVAAFLCMLPLAAGGAPESGGTSGFRAVPETVRIASLNGPSSIPAAFLFENHPDMGGAASYFEVAASPDVLIPRLLKGEFDVGVLPPNAAAKVYNASGGAVVAGAVTGNGMLSLLTTDPAFSGLESLRGRRVNVAGQGSTPDYIMRYILAGRGIPVSRNGTDPDGAVELDYSIPPAEIAAALISGKTAYAAVPEPFATVACMKSDNVRRALDMQAEYASLSHVPVYPMTIVVARADFARQYPDVFRSLLDAYRSAVDWTVANPAEAGVLTEKHTLGLNAGTAAAAIPNAAFAFSAGGAAKKEIETLLSVFLALDPDSVGGKLPDDGFYFE